MNQETIIIVIESPAKTRKIAPSFIKKYPHQNLIFLCCVPYGSNYVFQYPRGLSMQDYPLVKEPVIRIAEFGSSWIPQVPHPETKNLMPGEITDEIFNNAKEIIFACDPDHTGAMAFALLVEMKLGKDILSIRQFPSVKLFSLDTEGVETAIENMGIFQEDMKEALEYGRVKRYFDWNWNTNALVILGSTLRKLNIPENTPPLTKYSIQLLYWIAENNQQYFVGDVVHNMEYWNGTSKYKSRTSLGSPSSYAKILEDLKKIGLIYMEDTKRVRITSLGSELLEILHKDCQDFDIPFRIEQWGNLGFEQAKPLMDKYIKTFFGKQKRFLKN